MLAVSEDIPVAAADLTLCKSDSQARQSTDPPAVDSVMDEPASALGKRQMTIDRNSGRGAEQRSHRC